MKKGRNSTLKLHVQTVKPRSRGECKHQRNSMVRSHFSKKWKILEKITCAEYVETKEEFPNHVINAKAFTMSVLLRIPTRFPFPDKTPTPLMSLSNSVFPAFAKSSS